MNKDMMISRGRIAVYSPEHELQEARLYYSTNGMKRIMSAWMAIYPDGHYINVRPYTECERVKYRLAIVKPVEVKPKLVRPPAVYDNQKWI